MYDALKGIPTVYGNAKRNYTIALTVMVTVFISATCFTGFNPFIILKEQKTFWSFITQDFLPPDIMKANGLVDALLSTVEMALASTFISACLAFVLAFFGSNTSTPYPWMAKPIRALGSFMRNIPALVWSFILVMAFGIGTSVGLLALAFETFGFLTRAFIETIDEVGSESIEALNACGANFFQKIAQGIIPSVLAGYISWFLYCIEVNIRSSTIVGMVGGGGVGLVLMTYIKQFKYNVAGGIILSIALVVILVDHITNKLRRSLLV